MMTKSGLIQIVIEMKLETKQRENQQRLAVFVIAYIYSQSFASIFCALKMPWQRE